MKATQISEQDFWGLYEIAEYEWSVWSFGASPDEDWERAEVYAMVSEMAKDLGFSARDTRKQAA